MPCCGIATPVLTADAYARTLYGVPTDTPADAARIQPSPTPLAPGDLTTDRSIDPLVANARHEEIARRLLMQQRPFEIADALGVSQRQVHNVIRDPAFLPVYERVRDALYSNIDAVLFDEKAAPLLRARAQTTRAQTVIAEVIEEVRKRMAGGKAKATDMRVAVDAAFGMMDRSRTELAKATEHVHTNVSLNVNASTRDLIRSTIRESGLDLSDILPVVDVEAEAETESGT